MADSFERPDRRLERLPQRAQTGTAVGQAFQPDIPKSQAGKFDRQEDIPNSQAGKPDLQEDPAAAPRVASLIFL